ncbi:MAG: HAD family hydrolase [Verrucomicrobiota bacterium JB024]|nr:HAD family hydrolase [Verrucomicrobiota bacterium JB024]
MTASTPYAIAIDSDGCVFDNMTIKHRQCFGPALIEGWALEPVRAAVQEAWDHINLFSASRGINRFLALLEFWRTFPSEALPAGVSRPDITGMEKLVAAHASPSAALILDEYKVTGDAFLRQAAAWSESVNQRVAALTDETPAFADAVTLIKSISAEARVYVVSSANRETIRREWTEAGLDAHVSDYVTQERCSKQACLRGLIEEGYRTLMVGDSPGDLSAAQKAGSWFFPILPGQEAQSWSELLRLWNRQGVAGVFREHPQAVATYAQKLAL